MLLHGVYLLIAMAVSEAVKVNMMGSLSLGKDVIGLLSEYVKENLQAPAGRRMMSQREVPGIVRDFKLCQNIPFCRGTYESNINDYIVSLYTATETVFDGTLTGEPFKIKPKQYLKRITKILERADTRVTEENEVHGWTSVIKKISAVFQEKASVYAHDRVYTDEGKKETATRVLIHQLAIAISKVEMDYQAMFCTEHSICVKKMECTRALNEVLGSLRDLEDYKVQTFIKALKASMESTAMMHRLKGNVRKELTRVLDYMANTENSPIKEVLSTVKTAVEDRLAGKNPKGDDVVLMHIILSDMDHVFDMQQEPFAQFLSKFHYWIQTGDDLESSLKQLIKELTRRLEDQSAGLIFKLTTAVESFLELTIGSPIGV